MSPKKGPLVALTLGPMPTAEVYRATGHELDEGEIILSINAQKHAAKRHPEEYAKCLPHIGSVVANPLFIGCDFKNRGIIEFVSRVRVLGSGLLIAVNIESDEQGRYHVASFYPVSEQKITSRVEKGFLKRKV